MESAKSSKSLHVSDNYHIVYIHSRGLHLAPVDTGRELNVHKTFRRRSGRLLNVLCTFTLCLVPTWALRHGLIIQKFVIS